MADVDVRTTLTNQLNQAKAAGRADLVAKIQGDLNKLNAASGVGGEASTRPPPGPAAPQRGRIMSGIHAFVDEAKREARQVGLALGGSEYGFMEAKPEDQKFLEQVETFGTRAANAFGLGIPNAIADKVIGPGAPLRREELYSNPANRGAGIGGDILGGLASSVAGPAGLVGGAVRGVAKRIGGAIASRAPALAARAANKPFLATGATAATEGAAVNTAHNAIDPDAATLTQGLAIPLGIGFASALVGRGSAAVNRGLQGRKDSPNWIRRYRNYVESERGLHPPVRNAEAPGSLREEPRFYETEGLPPHPNDVFSARAAEGRVPEFRDTRDAAEEAAGQAMQHRATKARGSFEALEAEGAPYQGTRASRQDLIDDIDRQLAETKDPNLGVVDQTRHAKLLAVRQRLVETTPAKRPVMEGARVPTEQAELPHPGAPEVTLPPEPMARPAEPAPPQRQRVMFADEPGGPPGPLPENDIDHGLRALRESAERDAVAAREAVPNLPGDRSRQATRQARTSASQAAFDAANKAAEMRNLERMKPFVKVVPDEAPVPPMEPPQRWVQADPTAPPDPNVGRQTEISAPAPRTLPGIEPVAGPGPYQRELPGMDLDPEFRSMAEAMGEPTIGGLRRLRTEARSRAGFESREPPTPSQADARAEYKIYDRAIKQAAEKHAPEYLDIERRMAATAKGFRREGDLLSKTEGNLASGGNVGERAEVGPDELGAMVDEDVADQVSKIAERPRGVGRDRTRTAKQQGVATFMGRAGDLNDPGRAARAAIEELKQADPEYARLFQLVEDAKSVDAVKPGLAPLLPRSLQGATEAGGNGAIIRQNLRALFSRLPPVLNSLEKAAPRGGMLVPALRDPLDALLARLAAEKEQQAERTKTQKARQNEGKAVGRR